VSRWIGVIGDLMPGHAPQDAIAPAIEHAAAALGMEPPEVRWWGTDRLDAEGPDALADAAAIWCAPGSPYRSLDGALAGIRFARERAIPFLGTCAGFQHAVVEFARDVLGRIDAGHAEYEGAGEDLFIDELLCSLVGQRLDIELTDPDMRDVYGSATATERYYCRFGMAPGVGPLLESHGLRTVGVDRSDGEPRILRLEGHPYFVATLFVPQTSSTPGRPHPLVLRLLAAATATEPVGPGEVTSWT
jgi:CTP synthase (UTP-ammonia lyase)